MSPFLWFDGNAEEAVEFYLGIFPNSRRLSTVPKGDGGGALIIRFELDGQEFTALNGGPGFPFTEAVSFWIRCDNQEEVDFYWSRLTEGGREGQCCWLKDRFGLSWQVVPTVLPELIRTPAAFQAMLRMSKPIIADLEAAAAGQLGTS